MRSTGVKSFWTVIGMTTVSSLSSDWPKLSWRSLNVPMTVNWSP